jgi:hypothetical protein
MSFICCHCDECQHFGDLFGPVIEAITRANGLCFELVKESQGKSIGESDNVLWMLAASCLTEFEDIFLLAGNGRGVGATKVLRGLYERTVVFSYLAKHPDKIRQFVDYSDVHWNKLLIEATEQHATFSIPEEEAARIKRNYEKSEKNYQRVKCKTCNTTELNGSWTRKPVADMASDVNPNLRGLAFNAYFRPTLHIHTTYYGIIEQSDISGEHKLRFSNVEKQRELASEALGFAHILLLQVIDTLNDRFNPGRGEQVRQIAEEWKHSWEAIEDEIVVQSKPKSSPQPS